ncbi:MAG: sensor histidine kinase, partial [Lachnospiraceae bacterium]|nr:sensor histidine kinase [Lachnospiraceae bacterium]
MKIKLEHKNLSYSLLLAGCLLLFLTGYFIYMLPSLYVDYLMDENLKSIREQQRTFVTTGSYENIRVKNPTACFSLRVPN